MTALLDFTLSLYASLLVMRGLMDLAGVSNRPLLNRLIFLATEPVLRPFRLFLPRTGRLDWAIPLVFLTTQFIVVLLLTRAAAVAPAWPELLVIAMLRSVQLITLLLLALVVVNFILLRLSRPLNHPVVPLIREIVEWLLGPLSDLGSENRRRSGQALAHAIAAAILMLCLVAVSLVLLL